MRISLSLMASIFSAAFSTVALSQEIDWQKVDDAFGRKPAVSGDVHRYGFPRTDLAVTLDGVAIKPALALGGWVALKPAHGGAMVMGDLVLLETEINPVMLKLIEGGLEITAVHNHLLRASPATFYMHVGGHGDPAKMAAVIRDALSTSKTPLATPAAAGPAARDGPRHRAARSAHRRQRARRTVGFTSSACHAATRSWKAECKLRRLDRWGWRRGSTSSRPAAARPPSPAILCLSGDEVNPVINALRTNGIEVTAVHSHMLDEQPRLFFLHFWANDDAIKLARGLRAALDKTASTRS